MKGTTVEQSDLVGRLECFPIEVVQKMVNEQVRQGNKADVVVFQKRVYATRVCGGFDWDRSLIGLKFWMNVLLNEKFDTFFQKYQKNEK
jgi:hypothetical protein